MQGVGDVIDGGAGGEQGRAAALRSCMASVAGIMVLAALPVG